MRKSREKLDAAVQTGLPPARESPVLRACLNGSLEDGRRIECQVVFKTPSFLPDNTVAQPPGTRKVLVQVIVDIRRDLHLLNDAVNVTKDHLLIFGDAVGQPPESQKNLGYVWVFALHGLKVF